MVWTRYFLHDFKPLSWFLNHKLSILYLFLSGVCLGFLFFFGWFNSVSVCYFLLFFFSLIFHVVFVLNLCVIFVSLLGLFLSIHNMVTFKDWCPYDAC